MAQLARSIASLSRGMSQQRTAEALGCTCSTSRIFLAGVASSSRQSDLDSSGVEVVDPFLAKLQHQTEASYLELLSRKDKVAPSEDEALMEEKIEERARERGEWGGPNGPEPTRFGDWEKAGRCSDF